MAEILFKWIQDKDFTRYTPITQVYGICFNVNEEILIIKRPENNFWKIPGGTPEQNETLEETLKREMMEEATVTVKDCQPLGVVEVVYPNNPNAREGEKFYQARFTCNVKSILPNTADPDNGVLHDRKFVPMNEVTKWVKWEESGDQMFADAIKTRNDTL